MTLRRLRVRLSAHWTPWPCPGPQPQARAPHRSSRAPSIREDWERWWPVSRYLALVLGSPLHKGGELRHRQWGQKDVWDWPNLWWIRISLWYFEDSVKIKEKYPHNFLIDVTPHP